MEEGKMKMNNEHIEAAYRMVSSLSVSGDVVDIIWAVRQQLLMADADFAAKEGEGDGGQRDQQPAEGK